jgi:hypothetical protein
MGDLRDFHRFLKIIFFNMNFQKAAKDKKRGLIFIVKGG